MAETSLCGNPDIDCIDCCGFGVCDLTYGMNEDYDTLTNEIKKAFKDSFGYGIEEIKGRM